MPLDGMLPFSLIQLKYRQWRVLNPLSRRFFSFFGKGVVQQKREADCYLCAQCVRRKVDTDVVAV